MEQYLNLGKRIVNEGIWIENERTNKKCLTVINADLTYDVDEGKFPLITTRKAYWKSAIAELLAYIRGYDNAADFRELGTKTWDANANENEAWLNNPNRKGTDDLGYIYGAVGRKYPELHADGTWTKSLDTLKKIVDDLSNGIDDRGEILSFWMPGSFDMGCLRPCMYEHHFSLLGDTLYLNSTQRSVDYCLGLTFNMPQVYVFLALMAQITGNKAGKAFHKLVNVHIYEDQYKLFKNEQMDRIPFESPKLWINPKITSLQDLETWVTLDDFEVLDYQCHDPIKYPFAV